jgi:hypothetical protein
MTDLETNDFSMTVWCGGLLCTARMNKSSRTCTDDGLGSEDPEVISALLC